MFFTTLLLVAQAAAPPQAVSIEQGTVSPYFMAADWRSPLRIRIPVRRDWAQLIGEHTRDMIKEGWADDLSSRDLDHGHMLMRPDWTCPNPCTPDDVLDGVRAFLYHTAENAGRWAGEGEAGIDIDERRPRSIVGWSSGVVQPAVELIWKQRYALPVYVSNGTVFDTDLQRFVPKLFTSANEYPVTFSMNEGTLTCSLSTQIRIVQDSQGRMLLKDGRPFDAYLVCFDPVGTLEP